VNETRPEEILEVPFARLDFGDPITTTQNGEKVTLQSPAGWKRLPRDSDYVGRFYPEVASALPRIDVSLDTHSYKTQEITRETIHAFRDEVAGELASQDIDPIEPPLSMVLGDQLAVRYVRGGRWKGGAIERQIIHVKVGKNFYKVELAVLGFPEGEIVKFRDQGYTVAASIKPAN